MYLQQLSNDHKQNYNSAMISLFNKEHINFRMFVVSIIFNIEKLKKEKNLYGLLSYEIQTNHSCSTFHICLTGLARKFVLVFLHHLK